MTRASGHERYQAVEKVAAGASPAVATRLAGPGRECLSRESAVNEFVNGLLASRAAEQMPNPHRDTDKR